MKKYKNGLPKDRRRIHEHKDQVSTETNTKDDREIQSQKKCAETTWKMCLDCPCN
jgi:hypothetical protein